MQRLARLSPVLSFLFAGTAAAAPARLEPLAADDLAAPAVAASDAPSTAPPGGPVRFTWPIDQAADDLDIRPAPHRAEAIGHSATVQPAELRRGSPLPISHPGAFLKLSRQTGAALDPAALTLVDPQGVRHTGGAGLRPVGGPDSGAFTLDPALGVGRFTLEARLAEPAHIDVLERGSDIVLVARADRDVVFAGGDLHVDARLLRAGAPQIATITARLRAPDGRDRTLPLDRDRDHVHRGHLRVPDSARPGLWTLELRADATLADRPVRRTTTTAVAISAPTARLTGAADVDHRAGALRSSLALEVASAGRYAVTAVLHGTNREGALQPIAVGQSADDLAPGRRHLELEFDAATISASGMGAPFELRDLRLVDQGRMLVLHRQARALVAR